MKKTIPFLLLVSCLARPLQAQEAPIPAEAVQDEPADDSVGQASLVATKSGQENNWQNWVFVGGALVAAAVAVLVVSLDSGSSAH